MQHRETTVYLVRHAATQNNVVDPPRLQGRHGDLPLSDIGIRQARRVAEALAPLAIDAIYTSPLRRAVETAECIGRRGTRSVCAVPELTEIDVGEWEGKSWSEIAAQYPHPHAQFMANPAEHGYFGGENLAELRNRVLPALMAAVHRHPGCSIVVVAHKTVNRVIVADLLGVPLSQARILPQDNGGINVLIGTSERMALQTLNATFHLSLDGPPS